MPKKPRPPKPTQPPPPPAATAVRRITVTPGTVTGQAGDVVTLTVRTYA